MPPPREGDLDRSRLSPREFQIAERVARGLSNEQVAAKLNLSRRVGSSAGARKVVRQNLVSGNTDGMALLIMPNTHSVFWTLEFLGYFWQGVAAGFLARALGRGRLQLWIRWLFAAVFVAGAVGIVDSILGVASFTDPLMLIGTAPWLAAFPAATGLCAIHLRRLLKSATT